MKKNYVEARKCRIPQTSMHSSSVLYRIIARLLFPKNIWCHHLGFSRMLVSEDGVELVNNAKLAHLEGRRFRIEMNILDKNEVKIVDDI